jgi:hypothetical protein
LSGEAFALFQIGKQTYELAQLAGGLAMRTAPVASVVLVVVTSLTALGAEKPQGTATSVLVGTSVTLECRLAGSTTMPLEVAIYAKDKGDSKIARFTGMPSGLTVLELPGSTAQRAHVMTGTGDGGFAIDGWVDVTAIPLYATANLPVVPGHVWIQGGQRVEFESKHQNQVRVQKTVTSPFAQSFLASTSCSNLSITPVAAIASEVARWARGYAFERNELQIAIEPKGEPAFKLVRSSVTNSVFLYGMDKKDDWVRVRYYGPIGVDAWVKSSDVRLLPKGERVDEYVPATQAETGRLRIVESGKVVSVPEKVQVRSRPAPDAAVIGDIEPATEVLILDVAAGWAAVLPKALNVAPPPDRQFWVEARKVGIQSKAAHNSGS